jgi:hypothetical protein
MTKRARPVLFATAALILAACATTPNSSPPVIEHGGATREQFMQYAGPPVDSFTWLARYYGWKPLGNQQVVMWTSINEAYLLTVTPPCVGLDFANGIRLTTTTRTVTRGVDGILVQGQKCFITQIRPVDYAAMKKNLHTIP